MKKILFYFPVFNYKAKGIVQPCPDKIKFYFLYCSWYSLHWTKNRYISKKSSNEWIFLKIKQMKIRTMLCILLCKMKWFSSLLCFFLPTSRMLKGAQHIVKTMTTVTIIFIIWKYRKYIIKINWYCYILHVILLDK